VACTPIVRLPTVQFVRVSPAEYLALVPDCLVADEHPALGQEFLHVAVTQGEAEVAPDGVPDNRGREARALVAGSGCLIIHAPRIAHPIARKPGNVS
jgi:hypothetical protein